MFRALRRTVQLILIINCCINNVVADVCTDPGNPCKHGRCQPRTGGYNWGYECVCDQGYLGAQCQWDSMQCHEDTTTPCQNGGTCMELKDGDGRYCACPFASNFTIKFGGHYCELVDPCEICPLGTYVCQTAPTRATGCICLDSKYKEISS